MTTSSISELDFASPAANDAAEIASIFDIGDNSTPSSTSDGVPGGASEGAPTVAAPAAGGGADPSPPAATPITPPVPGAPEAPQGGTPPAPTSPPAPADPLPPLADQAAPAAPAAPNAEALELASLRALVADLQREKQQSGGADPATPAAPTAEEGPEVPAYQLSIPNELGQALLSDDPATNLTGITHLVNSLAQHVHKTVLTQVQGILQARDQQVQTQTAAQQEVEAARQMQEDYYGTYPTHNTPAIKAIVAHEAGQMAVQYPALPWGPDYKAALGARVNAALAALGATPAEPVTTTTPAAVPPAKPAAFAPTTPSRSSIPAFEEGQLDMIDSTFAPD